MSREGWGTVVRGRDVFITIVEGVHVRICVREVVWPTKPQVHEGYESLSPTLSVATRVHQSLSLAPSPSNFSECVLCVSVPYQRSIFSISKPGPAPYEIHPALKP